MRRQTNQGTFWISYADLMTSLFLLMLVLFAVTTYVLVEKSRKIEIKLKDIMSIEQSVRSLPKNYFVYDSVHRRHQLNEQVNFSLKSDIIPESYHAYLLDVGGVLQDSIASIRKKYKERVKFTLLIEGMSSNLPYTSKRCPEAVWEDNYTLSYRRALSLKRFWDDKGIKFDPTYCDIQIAGSGEDGIGRLPIQRLNQRFLIQILPKVGDINK